LNPFGADTAELMNVVGLNVMGTDIYSGHNPNYEEPEKVKTALHGFTWVDGQLVQQ